MAGRLSGQVAIVTGGASGIGQACVQNMLREGARVLVTDLASAGSEEVRARLEATTGEAVFLSGDVTEPADCAAAVSGALSRWGRLDILVGNAGLQAPGALLESTVQGWKTTLNVNLLGLAWSIQAVLPAMQSTGGSIVAVSSINALTGFPGMAAYDAAKAGVLALVRHVAVEYGRYGIRANAVCPGATITEFHLRRAAERGMDPAGLRSSMAGYGLLGRAGEPHEIASAITFLASSEASFITGQALAVDGGVTAAGSGK